MNVGKCRDCMRVCACVCVSFYDKSVDTSFFYKYIDFPVDNVHVLV